MYLDYNEIMPNLFLGNVDTARDQSVHKEHNIKFILTIENLSLTQDIIDSLEGYLFLESQDMSYQNIIQFFEKAYHFIDASIQKGACLVHCFAGISRSASLVIAYFMKKMNLSYKDARAKVCEKRHFIYPNEGFQKQLKLYEAMKCSIVPSYYPYRLLMFELFQNRIVCDYLGNTAGILSEFLESAEQSKLSGSSTTISCKMCRSVLAKSIIHHFPGKQPNFIDPIWMDEKESFVKSRELCKECVFIEPQNWMKGGLIGGIEGPIACYKCQAKVGKFSWESIKCSCGLSYQPGFALQSKKVDVFFA